MSYGEGEEFQFTFLLRFLYLLFRPDTFSSYSGLPFGALFIYFFLARFFLILAIFPQSRSLFRCLAGWSTYYGGVGSGEYSSRVYLQSGRRMFAGLLKDEFSPFFSGNVLYIRVLPG